MTVLAHSELLARIADIDASELEAPFEKLANTNTTPKRLQVLKALAKEGSNTISYLLDTAGFPRTGGSYTNIKRYFTELEQQGMLQQEQQGRITKWKFSPEGEQLRKYIWHSGAELR